MPNALVEDAGRDHVYDLRHSTFGDAEIGPSAPILGPILQRLDRAIADLLEYNLDVSGGVDGITDTFVHIGRRLLAFPGGPLWRDPTAPVTGPIPLNLAEVVETYGDARRELST
ncbi:hypothetical protein [Microbacterium sp. XT11]|uniref:hypothetical protein n=1 Tax=Microbacterium sp. XT11 TaxID=367477 RepID=UPI000831F6FC|nr:hypothetical protein [Microbacterium sp. XT11]